MCIHYERHGPRLCTYTCQSFIQDFQFGGGGGGGHLGSNHLGGSGGIWGHALPNKFLNFKTSETVIQADFDH